MVRAYQDVVAGQLGDRDVLSSIVHLDVEIHLGDWTEVAR